MWQTHLRHTYRKVTEFCINGSQLISCFTQRSLLLTPAQITPPWMKQKNKTSFQKEEKPRTSDMAKSFDEPWFSKAHFSWQTHLNTSDPFIYVVFLFEDNFVKLLVRNRCYATQFKTVFFISQLFTGKLSIHHSNSLHRVDCTGASRSSQSLNITWRLSRQPNVWEILDCQTAPTFTPTFTEGK